MTVSPLSALIRDRRVNTILEDIRRAVQTQQPISIAPKDVDYIRRNFSQALALGERKLYELARLLMAPFARDGEVRVTLVVIGRCPTPGHDAEPIRMEKDLTNGLEELLASDDAVLAGTNTPICPECGKATSSIASFVRHEPTIVVATAPLLFVTTRIKTTSNIAYKIADMVFDIDRMFQRDKIYNEYSTVLTDIYGVKAVVRDKSNIRDVHHVLKDLSGVSVMAEKDYTGERRKQSGFEAYKVVVRKDLQLFEIQIQSREMFEVEQQSRSANHRTYKERLTNDRRKLGAEYSRLSQMLSRLFSLPDKDICDISYIELRTGGKGLDDEF